MFHAFTFHALHNFAGNLPKRQHVINGVVLTGTGRDGARGCQEIKAKGGVTIAQDEQTARYSAMPKAAIEADAIDYVLPLKEIAGKITDCLKREM